MGSELRLGLEGDTRSPAVDAAVAEVHALEAMLSTWRPQSLLSRLNRREFPEGWVEVPAELCRLLRKSRRVFLLSGGAFDPAVHGLIELWGFETDSPRRPCHCDIRRLLRGASMDMVEEDCEGAPRLRFKHAETRLNFGGIAKGFAMDELSGALKRAGFRRGVIAFGRSWLVWGYSAQEPYVVEMDDPARPGSLLGFLDLAEGAVAASSQEEQFFEEGGRRYGHILDPRSGYPARPRCRGVAIFAPRATDADALSTALFVMGRRRGNRLMNEFPEAGVLWLMPSGGGVRTEADGSMPFRTAEVRR
jgi:thiamine biosynthesis lipoprotein